MKLQGSYCQPDSAKGRSRRPSEVSYQTLIPGHVAKRTETVPQVKQLTMKQAPTHTQPYPPSGGDASSRSATSSVSMVVGFGCSGEEDAMEGLGALVQRRAGRKQKK